MRRIGIIGGGASGMTAAIAAKRTDLTAEVFILEHKDVLGKKILSTGNGRCNLTNMNMSAEYFRGEDAQFAGSVLRQFDEKQTLEFFHSLGVLTRNRGEYVYPRSEQAADVRESLQMEVERLGISCYMNEHVSSVRKDGEKFIIAGEKRSYEADRIVIACGGRAACASGSDGSGYKLAKALGHTLVPVVPALVQLKVSEHPFAKAAGVRCEAAVTAYVDGKEAASDTGELQITAYGISGIPVFQISRYISRGLSDGKKAQVKTDFLPDMTMRETEHFLLQRAEQYRERAAGDYLTGIFNRKLIPRLLELADIRIKTPAEALGRSQIKKLADVCKGTMLDIKDTNGFDQAQVCAGGIRTSEVNPDTMESLLVKGLYLSGEILDIDGPCGGFNLQNAWSTGHIAGRHAASEGL